MQKETSKVTPRDVRRAISRIENSDALRRLGQPMAETGKVLADAQAFRKGMK